MVEKTAAPGLWMDYAGQAWSESVMTYLMTALAVCVSCLCACLCGCAVCSGGLRACPVLQVLAFLVGFLLQSFLLSVLTLCAGAVLTALVGVCLCPAGEETRREER